MKSKFTIIFCLIAVALNAQITYDTTTVKNSRRLYIRVYDLHGHKFAKGQLKQISDNSLVIRNKLDKDTLMKIDVSSIGYIRTKHSIAHNVLWGSAIAVGTGALLGGIDAETTSEESFFRIAPAEEATIVGMALLPVGASIGLISGVAKYPRKFKIDGILGNGRLSNIIS